MNSSSGITSTAVSVASADIDGMTLVILCHLYASVTQWLSVGNTGVNNAMVSSTGANDMTFKFSSPDCTYYNLLTENGYGVCAYKGVLPRYTYKVSWNKATRCLFYHFMVTMNARGQCANISAVNDTKNKTTMTLISKDRHFYSFITEFIYVKRMRTNTIMAMKVKQLMKEGIFNEPERNCEIYHKRVSQNYEQMCTYNTHCKTRPSHYACTWHRFMADLGAESVCDAKNQHGDRSTDDVSTAVFVASKDSDGTTLIVLCHLYASVMQWLSAGNTGVNNSVVSGTDANNMTFKFSSPDCTHYNSLTKNWDCTCASNVHNEVLGKQNKLTWTGAANCLFYHFMIKMGAREQCANISEVNDTKNETTMTLLSKDRHFYSFITEFIGVKRMCTNITMAMNVERQMKEGILSERNCEIYGKQVLQNYEKMCTYNTHCKTGPSHYACTWYRVMAGLGAESVCHAKNQHGHRTTDDKTTACEYYDLVMVSIVGGIVCLIGLVCNLISLCTFCRGKVKTPTSYQFQWLAGVDSLFLVLFLSMYAVYYAMRYWQYHPDNVYFRVIVPPVRVYIVPLYYIVSASTNWLTVFIAVYRCIAICKPYGNLYHHLERHGQKYVVIVLLMASIYNIPYFFYKDLVQNEKYCQTYFSANVTSLGNSDKFKVYGTIIVPVLSVCIPFIILLSVTTLILVKLRKRSKKKSNMQSAPASKGNVNAVLIGILVTFIIAQFPYVVYFILMNVLRSECGSFMFYFSSIQLVCIAVNSAANPFIYFIMNKEFRSSLGSCCQSVRNSRSNETETNQI